MTPSKQPELPALTEEELKEFDSLNSLVGHDGDEHDDPFDVMSLRERRQLAPLLSKAIDAARRCLSAERELAKVSERLRWYRAAHMLVADEFAWVGHRERDDVRLAFLGKDENWDPILYVMCSDTFAWACADAEKTEYADAEKLLAIAVEDGWYGLIRWVQAERERRGEIAEPIEPVRKMFASYDDAKQRAEAAERSLSEVKAERDELKARVGELEGLLFDAGEKLARLGQ